MAETKYRPSIKIELVFAMLMVIPAIIAFIFIPEISLTFLGIVFFSMGTAIVLKKFTVYILTDENEIMSNYKFITESNALVRTDQVTSLKYFQTFMHKWFDLGTLTLHIFGKTGALDAQGQATKTGFTLPTLKMHKRALSELSAMFGLDKGTKVVYREKPSIVPSVAGHSFFFVLIVLASYLLWRFFPIAEAYLFIIGITVLLLLIVLVSAAVRIPYLLGTEFILRKEYLEIATDFYLWKSIEKVAYERVTNYHVHKNIIMYALFRVGDITIYTGGSHDPKFELLEHFESCAKHLHNLLNKAGVRKELKKETVEKTRAITPGLAFFLQGFVSMTFIFVVLPALAYVFLTFPFEGYVLAGGSVVYVLYLLYRFLLLLNTKYWMHEDRIIVQTGVINIRTDTVKYANMKYVSLQRPIFYDILFGQGSVHIHTPGTASTDVVVRNIKEYDKVFETLKKETNSE